jgi:hypothetical protein
MLVCIEARSGILGGLKAIGSGHSNICPQPIRQAFCLRCGVAQLNPLPPNKSVQPTRLRRAADLSRYLDKGMRRHRVGTWARKLGPHKQP